VVRSVAESQSARRYGLDLTRGVAALAVLAHHSYAFLGCQLFWRGYLAVDLFFMVSGFVLEHQYGSAITGGMGFKEFATRRLVRLYPCYLLGFTLGVVLESVQLTREHGYCDTSGLAAAAIANLLLLPTPGLPYHGTGELFPFNPVTWSLMYELIVSGIYWWCRKKLSPIGSTWVLGASGIAFVVAAVHYGSTEGGWGPGQSLLGFSRVMFSFFAGVTLCRYRPSGVALPRASGNTVLLAGTATLLLILHGPAWSWGLCYELAAIFAVFPILVLALSQAQPGRRSIACCRFAGAVSYPVYLLQVPLMLLIRDPRQADS
jgi:peptidoglycan/LPS O-acetylase OafA/YrhL